MREERYRVIAWACKRNLERGSGGNREHSAYSIVEMFPISEFCKDCWSCCWKTRVKFEVAIGWK